MTSFSIAKENPKGVMYYKRSRIRVVLPIPTWTDMLVVAVDEIRLLAATSIQVSRRLRAMLEDLERIAPQERKESINKQPKLLDQAIEREVRDPRAQELSRQADMRGTGF